MKSKLHYKALRPLLMRILKTLMRAEEFRDFRLVGGTAISLYRGHRVSDDLDMFSDAGYDSIDFKAIDSLLRKTYSYVDTIECQVVGPGKSYYVGNNKDDCIKLDLFYTDKFIRGYYNIDCIRLAAAEDIIAMKIDVICRGGRKKDYWDIHELKDDFPIDQMMSLHKERYPYNHDPVQIKNSIIKFDTADDDFDPICLKGKHWGLIKLDLIDFTGLKR